MDISLDAVERILEWKHAKRTGFPVETFKDPQIPLVIRNTPEDQRILK
jgi:hypothetical protein